MPYVQGIFLWKSWWFRWLSQDLSQPAPRDRWGWFFLDLIWSLETGENHTNQLSKATFQNTSFAGEHGQGGKPKGTKGESEISGRDRVATNKSCDLLDVGLPSSSPIGKVFVTTLVDSYSCSYTGLALTCYKSYNNNMHEPVRLRRLFR